MARHIMLNGEIQPSSQPCLTHDNRGLLMGDSFSIKLRGNSCFVYDFKSYFQTIEKMIELYGMVADDYFCAKILANDIMLLLRKNRIYKEFAVTITLFRNNEGQEPNSFSTLLSVESIDQEFYQLNKNGIFTDIFVAGQDIMSSPNPKLFIQLRCKEIIKENNLDDIIITSNDGIYRHGLNSDIFFMKDNTLIAATKHNLSSANSVFSAKLEELAHTKLEMEVIHKEMQKSELKNIDAMFLADPILGIRWVVGLGRERFYHGKVEDIAYEIQNYYKVEIKKLKGEE